MQQLIAHLTRHLVVACAALIALHASELLAGFHGVRTGAVAMAEESQRTRVRRTPALRQQVFSQLEKARDMADEGNLSDAQRLLGKMLDGSALNSYERAMTWNLRAYVYYAEDNYEATARAYARVLEQDNLPLSLEQNTLYSLIKLNLVQERYKEALPLMNRWFGLAETPGAEAWILKAQIHYQLKQYDEALGPVRKAIELGEQNAGKPAENWYLLARAVYYQKGDYRGLRDVLKSLVRHYPKRQYWVQLSAVYGELGQEKQQVAAMEAAYEQGLLDREQDYVMLARQLMSEGIPYKAAQVMVTGMDAEQVVPSVDNLRLTADAWFMAREHERAIETMSRAASRSNDGELYLRLSQIYLDQSDFNSALEAAAKAASQGGLDRPDVAEMIQGLALFNLDRLQQARKHFAKAARYEDSEAAARQWLGYIERESNRRKQLANALAE